MKYFTNELWHKINDENEEVRLDAEKQWDQNAKSYTIIYNSIKGKLPKRFINIYEKEYGFHDWNINSIDINQKLAGNKIEIEVEITVSNYSKVYQISFKGIKDIKLDYRNNDWNEGFDDWGYSEIMAVDNKTFSFEILFASESSILLHFEEIFIKNIKQ